MGVIGACAGCCWVRRCQAWRFQLHPADGRQERQARGEREREGAEDEVPAVKGVAERRILGVYELVLAGLVARASPSVLGSSRSPRPWRSWRPSAACRRKCPVWRLCAHQQPAHAPLTPIACFADRWPALSRQIQVFATSYDRHVQLHSTTAKRSRRHRQGRGGKDTAAGDGSAEEHFSAYCYYCRTLHPSRARGRRAREGARRVATPSLS